MKGWFIYMPRFFIDIPLFDENDCIALTGETARHIVHSLRMRTNEQLTLCDKNGFDYICHIDSIDNDVVFAVLDDKRKNETEATLTLNVFPALLKSDKLELAVQKLTELGAAAFYPLQCARCVVKVGIDKQDKKSARLQKIALEAAKQSGRGRIPPVHPIISFAKAIDLAADMGSVILFYENGGAPLRTILPSCTGSISIFTGPEGGFTDEEIAIAKRRDVRISSLGPRILRAETAPLVAASAIFYAKGDLE